MEHTIFGLVKKRGELAGQHKVAQKAADAFKADLDAIDRALVLVGYQEDPKAIPARGKYKQLPLDAFTSKQIAASRSTKSILRDAKIVPDVTLNWCAHALHLNLRRVVIL